jgi:hypothetical protein
MKTRTGCDRATIEVRCTKNKRARQIGKPARPGIRQERLKQPRVWTTGSPFAIARASALGHAGDAPKNRTESATQNI